jgi:hypothetical protein
MNENKILIFRVKLLEKKVKLLRKIIIYCEK